MDRKDLHVGMRNLKTALSVFLCLLLYQFFPGNAAYACVAALITLQSTLRESFAQGRARLAGVAVGGALGALAAAGRVRLIFPFDLLLVSAGVSALIFLCNLMGRGGVIVMGCVVYLELVFAPSGPGLWFSALGLLLDNALGILIAYAVNRLLRPPASPAEK